MDLDVHVPSVRELGVQADFGIMRRASHQLKASDYDGPFSFCTRFMVVGDTY